MNEYEIMIKNLENRVTELEKLTQCRGASTLTIRKWQPKGGDWRIDVEGRVFEFANNEVHYHFGTARKTKEQAERAAVEMRKFNRLLALRAELCGDAVVDFNNNSFKYYLYFNHADKSWYIDFNDEHEVIMPYFTSRETAQKACDMLNSGEVEL